MGGRQFISSVLIYRKCAKRKICLLHGKSGFLKKKLLAHGGGAAASTEMRGPLNPPLAVDCRRPSLSCRRCPHLERPAASRHVRIVSACFPKPSEDAPLPAFFSVTFVQCLRSDSCHYGNTLIILHTYFLSYLQENAWPNL